MCGTPPMAMLINIVLELLTIRRARCDSHAASAQVPGCQLGAARSRHTRQRRCVFRAELLLVLPIAPSRASIALYDAPADRRGAFLCSSDSSSSLARPKLTAVPRQPSLTGP